MAVLKKIVSIFVHIIIPKRFHEGFDFKVKKTYDAFNSTLELRMFWKIIFLPLNLVFSLLTAIFKTLLAWILPQNKYRELAFSINEFYNDIVVRKTGVALAFKRNSLRHELFVKGRERKVSCGKKNPDKTFYVIRPYYYLTRNELTVNVSNLLMHYYRNLQHLAYAVEKGWIPVVDWENYGPFPHEEDYPVNGTVNCWEYYWNQPSEYTLEEVYQSKNVILSVQNTRDNKYVPSCAFKSPLQQQAAEIASKCPQYDRLITLNDYTAKYVQEKQEQLFPEGSRILGVAIRGTSYGVSNSKTDISGQPVQPELDNLISSIKEAIDEWKMDYVFITCELESVILKIEDAIKDKVIYLPRIRYQTPPKRGDVEKNLDPLYVPGQKYQTNLDYVTEMVLLSRCTSLLAAMSSGVRAALIWNDNKYENMRIFDNGLW